MYEKLVKYAAKQLEIDASEIRPDSTFPLAPNSFTPTLRRESPCICLQSSSASRGTRLPSCGTMVCPNASAIR